MGARSEKAMQACATWLNDYAHIRTMQAGVKRRLRPADTLAIHRQHRDGLECKLRAQHAGRRSS